MIELAGMSLIMTDKCNASCRHCGLSAGPDKNSVILPAQAREYLEALSRQKSALIVSYTGGEPFLYYEYLREIISSAARLGFYGEVVTNSFWARDIKKTQEILKELRAIGVVNFVTSLDDFHAEFVDPEFVKNAVRAASELGLNVTVKVMGSEKDEASTGRTEAGGTRVKYTHEYVQELLAADTGNIKVVSQQPVFSGRAARQADADIARQNQTQKGKERQSAYGRCTTVIRFPSINPVGEVRPCCGFGEKQRLLGKAGGAKSLDEIFVEMQNNLFLNMLAYQGPLKLLDSARTYLEKPPRENFGNICEVCNYLLEDADANRAVRRLLTELAGRHASFHGHLADQQAAASVRKDIQGAS